ncbi:MAG: ribonuclease [Candidatus Saccharibacteria bacterium]|nr:ribonuclease [Candidatus Saccharibacteria bacterium]
MLAKLNRFHGHQSVRRIYKQGRSQRNELGSLHVYVDPKHPAVHVAVVVSKKVHKSAVVRNRIRRRVYELVRVHMAEFKQQANLVFTIYQLEAASMPAEKLAAEVKNLLERSKIL